MNAREAAQLLTDKLPESAKFSVHEFYNHSGAMNEITIRYESGTPKTFKLSLQTVTDFSAAARAAIDWARNQEVAKGEVVEVAASVPKPQVVPSPVKVKHEWEASGSVSLLMENGKGVGGCCMSSYNKSFYWSVDPGGEGYCPTLEAAKAACIAKRLETTGRA